MPGTPTTPDGLPFPVGADTPNVPRDVENLANATQIALNNLRASIAAIPLIPAGVIAAWAAASPPAGWASCNGTLLNRSVESRLFAAIGVRYGAGDGVSTFATPNIQQRVIVAAGGAYGLGATGGAATHTLILGETPPHSHRVISEYQQGGAKNQLQLWHDSAADAPSSTGREHLSEEYSATPYGLVTSVAGQGHPHNNMQPYLVLNYVIKL